MSETRCSFCSAFTVDRGVNRSAADRLLATHHAEKHRQEIRGLSSSAESDQRLLLQFGDLIDQFEEDIRKRQITIRLMTDLNETFRKRIAEAEAALRPSLVLEEPATAERKGGDANAR